MRNSVKYIKYLIIQNIQILSLSKYLVQRAPGCQHCCEARLISVLESLTHLLCAVSAQTRSMGPHRPKYGLELALIDHDTTEEWPAVDCAVKTHLSKEYDY
jgi:hypothetical protein